MDFDVFNGDADGILSLVQLRRAAPMPHATLVTGRKRDINLLSRVQAGAGDNVTVLDISARSNADDLKRILDAGADVFYVDHHNAGDISEYPNLTTVIDTSPETCTAVLVDHCLGGAYRAWAVTAAFGDNFPKVAKRIAEGHNLPLDTLERLGILINYNGYGASVDDLHFHPADLYQHLADYDTPMEFLSAKPEIYTALDKGYEADMAGAKSAKVLDGTDKSLVLVLPGTASSRRVSGVYGNALAQAFPNRAHAILTEQEGGYLVSIRAPLSNRRGADTLALKYETGGGRAAAAGINHLPEAELTKFVSTFRRFFKYLANVDNLT